MTQSHFMPASHSHSHAHSHITWTASLRFIHIRRIEKCLFGLAIEQYQTRLSLHRGNFALLNTCAHTSSQAYEHTRVCGRQHGGDIHVDCGRQRRQRKTKKRKSTQTKTTSEAIVCVGIWTDIRGDIEAIERRFRLYMLTHVCTDGAEGTLTHSYWLAADCFAYIWRFHLKFLRDNSIRNEVIFFYE